MRRDWQDCTVAETQQQDRQYWTEPLGWTQPICSWCWDHEHPHRRPHAIVYEYRVRETCCLCSSPTDSGIYVRANPELVPFPTLRS